MKFKANPMSILFLPKGAVFFCSRQAANGHKTVLWQAISFTQNSTI